jgi:hypothetical protein
VPIITYNAAGQLTAVSTATITPAAIGAMPLWSTSNAIPKGNGSTGLTASSLTDNGTTVTTAEPLVLTGGTGFAAGSGLQINTANPAINMSATGMGTDTKNWVWWTSGSGTSGSLNLTAYNDALGVGNSAITIARTGAAIGNIAFGGPIVALAGATIGSGTGTAVLTSGVVSTLSGTNLVLGNGSTIPQSTFQPALSGGTTGALTKWTGSSTLGNAAWPDIQTGIGSQGAGLALMGPTSGPNASPTFRSIINTDLGSVAWGGSLAGTGPNPDVRGIWGLSVPTPTAGNLRYNGSAYAWDGTSYATSASLGSYLPLVAGSGNPLSGELYASASGTAINASNGAIIAGNQAMGSLQSSPGSWSGFTGFNTSSNSTWAGYVGGAAGDLVLQAASGHAQYFQIAGSQIMNVSGSGLQVVSTGTAILAGTGRISSAAIAVDALNAYNASLATGNNIGLAVGKSGALNQSGYVYWKQGATDAASVLQVETYAGGNPIEFNGSNYTFDGSGTATFSGTNTAISAPNGAIVAGNAQMATSVEITPGAWFGQSGYNLATTNWAGVINAGGEVVVQSQYGQGVYLREQTVNGFQMLNGKTTLAAPTSIPDLSDYGADYVTNSTNTAGNATVTVFHPVTVMTGNATALSSIFSGSYARQQATFINTSATSTIVCTFGTTFSLTPGASRTWIWSGTAWL